MDNPASCKPAIQPSVRCSNARISWEVKLANAHALAEKISRFFLRKLQVGLADLDNLSPNPKS